jgi:hypothetical protein
MREDYGTGNVKIQGKVKAKKIRRKEQDAGNTHIDYCS